MTDGLNSEQTPSSTSSTSTIPKHNNYWEAINYNLTSKDVDKYERYASLLELRKTLKICQKNIDSENALLVGMVESLSEDNFDELKEKVESFNDAESCVRNTMAKNLTIASEIVCAFIKHDYKSLKELRDEIGDDPKAFELILLLIEMYSDAFSKTIDDADRATTLLIAEHDKINPDQF